MLILFVSSGEQWKTRVWMYGFWLTESLWLFFKKNFCEFFITIMPEMLLCRFSIQSLSWHLQKLLVMQIMLQFWESLAMRFAITISFIKTYEAMILLFNLIQTRLFSLCFHFYFAVFPQLDWQQVSLYSVKVLSSFKKTWYYFVLLFLIMYWMCIWVVSAF